MFLPVEMWGVEPQSELGIPDASTVRSISLAEPKFF